MGCVTVCALTGGHILWVVLDPGNIAPTEPQARIKGVLILTVGTLVSAAHETDEVD